MAEAAGLGADDRQLVVLPLFHANAQYYSFASAIWAGGVGGAHAHASRQRRFLDAGRVDTSATAAPASLRRRLRMILARGAAPADGLQTEALLVRTKHLAEEQYDTVSCLVGLSPAPAVRHDRNHPGRAE